MKDGFRVFDTHTHAGLARHSGRTASADDLLRNMDRHGVDRSVVIPFPVVDDYRREHDLIGRAVKAHPDRLVGAACLNPYLPISEFTGEVRRCREVYGFRALKLQPQYHGLNPLSPAERFLLRERRSSNGMAAICHTGAGSAVFPALALHDAGAQVSGPDHRSGPQRRRHLRARGDSRRGILSQHRARTLQPDAASRTRSAGPRAQRQVDGGIGPAGKPGDRDRQGADAGDRAKRTNAAFSSTPRAGVFGK